MNRRLVVSNIAQFDLANIHDYIAERNLAAADRVVDQIEAAGSALIVAPFTGPAVGESHPGLRFRVVGKYVVFYRVTDEAVWIQRVIHSARDFEKLL